jgi:zinc transporter ZupT
LKSPKGLEIVAGASVVLVVLQSLCTAVVTVNGIRVLIGLGALAASSISAPLLEFHRDAIRIPMLILAVAGSLVNLAVLAWIWHLRSRPAAKWRQREIDPGQRNSERLQVAMALLTLALVGVELWAHGVVHHKPPVTQITIQS